jgi:hypothetical protein
MIDTLIQEARVAREQALRAGDSVSVARLDAAIAALEPMAPVEPRPIADVRADAARRAPKLWNEFIKDMPDDFVRNFVAALDRIDQVAARPRTSSKARDLMVARNRGLAR